MILGAHFNHWC